MLPDNLNKIIFWANVAANYRPGEMDNEPFFPAPKVDWKKSYIEDITHFIGEKEGCTTVNNAYADGSLLPNYPGNICSSFPISNTAKKVYTWLAINIELLYHNKYMDFTKPTMINESNIASPLIGTQSRKIWITNKMVREECCLVEKIDTNIGLGCPPSKDILSRFESATIVIDEKARPEEGSNMLCSPESRGVVNAFYRIMVPNVPGELAKFGSSSINAITRDNYFNGPNPGMEPYFIIEYLWKINTSFSDSYISSTPTLDIINKVFEYEINNIALSQIIQDIEVHLNTEGLDQHGQPYINSGSIIPESYGFMLCDDRIIQHKFFTFTPPPIEPDTPDE
jgi:hypothetical protein